MTKPIPVQFDAEDLEALANHKGTLVILVQNPGKLEAAGAKLDALTGGMLGRAMAASSFKAKAGTIKSFAYPSGLAAERVILACLGDTPDPAAARKTGGAIAAAITNGGDENTIRLASDDIGTHALIAELVWAMILRLYDFDAYKKADDTEQKTKPGPIVVTGSDPSALAKASAPFAALAEGVFFTRDLVNEPANILTTDEFAARLGAMEELGLDVEILGEDDLRQLGARALLAVGQGSDNESKLVVMKWMGGGDEAPLALVGKGVIFDTGGISLKPAAGMEEMTMDMGGAAIVSGVMRTLALRKARANVVGIVGLVENMPDARAQRPGDIVRSMKGDTIEVINTDAEGRLVLADALWYAQQEFTPSGVIDFATLTGAVIVALSKHMAGFFANNDDFAAELSKACAETGDEAWRLPLHKGYHDQIKSRLADIKNTGGRNGGACTAAAFLEKFIQEDMPWIHLDVAGVTLGPAATDLAPKGATGWGVAAINALIQQREIG